MTTKGLYDEAYDIRRVIETSREMDSQGIVDLGIQNGALALRVLKAEVESGGDPSIFTALADYQCCRNTERLAELARGAQ